MLLVGFAAAGFVLLRSVGWDGLASHQALLQAWVAQHPVAASGSFLLVYIVAVSVSVPNAGILTVTGGLLFGKFPGFALTLVGGTIGASILLLIVRSAFSGSLGRHRQRIPETMRNRMATDGFSYLLALRLVPLFPFWLVNLAAAVAGIRLAVYVPATLLGIAPTTFILSSIGAGVGGVLERGETPDLSVLFAPGILLPLIGLAVLSLLPAIFRRRKSIHA
jgi:uncharacterized membrane protein YdjX (TVP38/TMEM64 family)